MRSWGRHQGDAREKVYRRVLRACLSGGLFRAVFALTLIEGQLPFALDAGGERQKARAGGCQRVCGEYIYTQHRQPVFAPVN
jgi:hypothetical protein